MIPLFVDFKNEIITKKNNQILASAISFTML